MSAMRAATDRETADYLAGYTSSPGAVETEHGLLLPTCQAPGNHHSDDLVEMWHGSEEPAYLCGLRKQNTNAARRAERRFIKDVAAVYDGLIAAGTVGALVASSRHAQDGAA